jgi:hypothetical protein
MSIDDPLRQLVHAEVFAIDVGSDLAHHRLRYCRMALEALDRGERHIARSLIAEAWATRDSMGAEVGGRPLTPAELGEIERLRASFTH